MMATLRDGGIFKSCVDAIKDIVPQGNFNCDPDALSMCALDPSHVSMVRLRLQADLFDQFRCQESFIMGANIGSLHKIVKCMDKGDALTVSTGAGADTCRFAFAGESRASLKEFDLKLMCIEEEPVTIPEMYFPFTLSMSSFVFAKACRDLSSIGDDVHIALSEHEVVLSVDGDVAHGSLTFSTSGGDGLGGGVTISKNDDDDDDGDDGDGDDGCEAKVSLKYLTMMSRASPLGGTITLSMGGDQPILLAIAIGEGGSALEMFVAPRVDEGDEGDEGPPGGAVPQGEMDTSGDV